MRWPYEKVSQMNTLLKFYTFACDSLTWWTYVETALPPLGEFVLALFSFDWDDIARGFLRPAGIRSRAALLGEIAESFLVKKEIPEFGELIGAKLPGAKIVKSWTRHPVTRALFKIDAFLQRGVYYWMVLDLTTDFFYNWACGLFKTEVCAQASIAATYLYCTSQTPRAAKPDEWFWAHPVWHMCSRRWSTGGGVTNDYLRWGHPQHDIYVVWGAKFRAYGLKYKADKGDFMLQGTDGTVYDMITNVPAHTFAVMTAYVPAGCYVIPLGKIYGPPDIYRVTLEPILMQGWALVKKIEEE